MNDEIVFYKKDNFNQSSQNIISNLIIQLNDAINEDSYEEILEALQSLISHIKNYPMPINTVVTSYNFIPNLMNLFFSSEIEKSNLAAELLLKISFHSNLEFIQYFIENDDFIKFLNCLPSIENQQFLNKTLKIIINIINDFPQAKTNIYLNSNIIEFFFQTISNLSSSKENIEEMIAILSIISNSEIDFEQKKVILNFSIQLLENLQYKQFWPLLMEIIDDMIINSEISQFIFKETNVLKICQEFIRSDNESLQKSAIRCVGNHFIYYNKYLYICVDFGKIIKCAESLNEELSYISLWLLSNALACDTSMISMIECSGNIYQLLSSYYEQDRKLNCKLEACRGMISIIRQGNNSQIEKAIKSNFIYTFVQIIDMQDTTSFCTDGKNLVEKIIETLNFLINRKVIQMKKTQLKILCQKQFNESDGLEIINDLIHCDFPAVAQAAQIFLDKYTENYFS